MCVCACSTEGDRETKIECVCGERDREREESVCARERFLFKQTLIFSMDASGRLRTPYFVQFTVYSCVCMRLGVCVRQKVCMSVCVWDRGKCVCVCVCV